MKQSEHAVEIFLQPKDFYFGDENARLRTLLGSCVSITMWHPTKLIGDMCPLHAAFPEEYIGDFSGWSLHK